MKNVTKILVPTDFSEYSARALSRGVDIAKQNGAEIVLLHVVDQDIQTCTMDYCMQEEEVERQREAMLEGARDRVRKEAATFSSSGEIKISTEVVEGIPYEEILKFQDLNKVDLIVIATYGKSALAKYFLGSVSSNVLKGAKSEVLLVR
ncbi:MAG: universal stress protein [Syntrophorhabdaceae bacterium]|nr:universal stress protein [Syntrophorhabdaceae bacterium]